LRVQISYTFADIELIKKFNDITTRQTRSSVVESLIKKHVESQK